MHGLGAFSVPTDVRQDDEILVVEHDAFAFGFAVDDVVDPLRVELILVNVRSNDRLVALLVLTDETHLLLRILLYVGWCGRTDVR